MLISPLSVDINITNRCSLKCSFCSASACDLVDLDAELSLLELEKLFKNLEKSGVFTVRIAGGEPMIRSDFPQICKLLSKHSFEKILLTNGMHLNEKLTPFIKEAGFNSVAISIDGHNPCIHDEMRGVKGAFERTMSNLYNLIKLEIPYTAMCVVSKRNVNHLVETVEFLNEFGFSSVQFLLLSVSGRATETKDAHFPTFTEWENGFLKLNDFLSETPDFKMPVRILPPHEDSVPYEIYYPLKNNNRLDDLLNVWGINYESTKGISCVAGITQMTIFENGDVFGCDLMRDNDEWCAGNIRERSIDDIWKNSEIFNKLRSLQKDKLEGPCGSCSVEICGGGCRASAYNLTDKYNGSDLSCSLEI